MGIGDRLKAQGINAIKDGQRFAGSEDDSTPSVEDNTPVQLFDGTQTTIGELKKGYMRQSDYTKKTQEISEARRGLEEVEQELEARRQFAENINMYFAERPDVLQDAKYFLETGKSSLTNVKDKIDSVNKPETKEDKTMTFDISKDPAFQSLAQKIDTVFKGMNEKLSKFEVDKITDEIKKEENIKDDLIMSDALKRATKEYNNNLSFKENLLHAHRLNEFERLKEEQKMEQEKQNATLFSGKDNYGNPIRKTLKDELKEGISQVAPVNIFG